MILWDDHQTLLPRKQKSVSSKVFFDWAILAIMLAQTSFFTFAWTLAGLMMHKTIPLPDSRATWIQNNPSDTQVIVTLVSTILALIGSSLLGRAVQYALVRRLSHAPLRLYTMLEWAKLAQRSVSLNFDRHRLSWTLLSVAWVALLGFLTTAWSTLLAPESVVIYYDIQGNETNLLNPAVSDFFNAVGTEPPPGFNLTPADTDTYTDAYLSIDLAATLMDAGFGAAAAAAKFYSNNPSNPNSATHFINIPSSLYVNNISTGGILPPIYLVPPYYPDSDIGAPLYQGLSRTYNVTQQGFTASVSCRTPTSNDPAITPNLTNSVLINAGKYDEWAMDTYSWSTNCSSEVEYSTFGVTVISGTFSGGRNQFYGENGLLMTSVCFGQGFSGPSNQSFLVLLAAPSNSSYASFNQICQVTPLVTKVQTAYDSTGIINIIQPPLHQHPLPDPTGTNNTGVLMWFPAYTIWTTFVRSQGLTANMMGDRMLALQPTDYTSVVEGYLCGMMEYLGSLMANMVVYHPGTGPDVVVQLNGTVNARTFGWTFHLRTHGPSLAAITLVTVLTVAAGVFAMVRVDPSDAAGHTRKLQAPSASAHAFNPTGTMDVLLASCAGDLSKVLSESGWACRQNLIGSKHGDHESHGVDESLTIVLGMTDEGWPVLRTVTGVDVIGGGADVERRGSHLRRDRVGLDQADDKSNAGVAQSDEEVDFVEMRAKTGE